MNVFELGHTHCHLKNRLEINKVRGNHHICEIIEENLSKTYLQLTSELCNLDQREYDTLRQRYKTYYNHYSLKKIISDNIQYEIELYKTNIEFMDKLYTDFSKLKII